MANYLMTRPWRSEDLDPLRASESLFAPETYPRRFLAGGRRLRPFHRKVLEQLADPELRWTGQVAVSEGRLVALAECAWLPADPESATFAVNVAEAWQDGDLGYRTLRELATRCADLGLTAFNLDYVASNIALQSAVDAMAGQAGVRNKTSGLTRAGIGHVTLRAAR